MIQCLEEGDLNEVVRVGEIARMARQPAMPPPEQGCQVAASQVLARLPVSRADAREERGGGFDLGRR